VWWFCVSELIEERRDTDDDEHLHARIVGIVDREMKFNNAHRRRRQHETSIRCDEKKKKKDVARLSNTRTFTYSFPGTVAHDMHFNKH